MIGFKSYHHFMLATNRSNIQVYVYTLIASFFTISCGGGGGGGGGGGSNESSSTSMMSNSSSS